MPTNALSREKSPYLLQHAHNPVDWYPWGDEAFEKAGREDKPIFLSIGYSTCHWCHVMAHESFENEEIAKLMNEHFVNVKVDREERPDVDRVYMTYVQATTGGGGWPMSVFLTPDLKPFLGGTYFPPEDRYGRPGFPTVLQRIAEAWKEDRENIIDARRTRSIEQLQRIRGRERQRPRRAGHESRSARRSESVRAHLRRRTRRLRRCAEISAARRAQFSLPRLRAREGADSRDGKAALGMALLTLRKMADGRNARSPRRRLSSLLGGQVLAHPALRKNALRSGAARLLVPRRVSDHARRRNTQTAARDILDYVRRDMTDKNGGFYSAEDADSLHRARQTRARARAPSTSGRRTRSSECSARMPRRSSIASMASRPTGMRPRAATRTVNSRERTRSSSGIAVADAAKFFKKSEEEIAASLAESRKKLFDVRAKRPRPHLDDKIITAWNGLMISAFARAAQVLDDPAYLAAAQALGEIPSRAPLEGWRAAAQLSRRRECRGWLCG